MLNPVKYIVLLLIISAYSCTENYSSLNNTDLLFPNSIRLKVPAYSYSDSTGNIFKVQGDTFYYTGYPDTVNNLPLFKWDSFGFKLLTCAIFTSEPKVHNNEIDSASINSIIWQWHSGMNSGKEGHVQYVEGKNVIRGSIEYEQKPLPLVKGNYFWAVWGWTDDGTEILFSTRKMSFHVSE